MAKGDSRRLRDRCPRCRFRLKTPNQSRAVTLKMLIENKDLIEESLPTLGLASVEIVP